MTLVCFSNSSSNRPEITVSILFLLGHNLYENSGPQKDYRLYCWYWASTISTIWN